jgi:predicted dehydrogenase
MRLLLAGIGGYGEEYLRPLLEDYPNDRYKLEGVVDPFAEKSRFLPRLEELKVPVYDTLEAFYWSHGAELCVISAPIGLHRKMTAVAAKHGTNILCEKPAAGSFADALAMYGIAVANGVQLSIGYQWSFTPAMRAAKADILSGLYGKPVRFRSLVLWGRDLAYYARNNWAGKRRDAAGHWVRDSILQNATAHYLHNAFFMQGAQMDASADFVSLEAHIGRANAIETFDTVVLRAVMDNGAEVLYYASHAVDGSWDPEVIYEFENGCITCTNWQLRGTLSDGRSIAYGQAAQKAYEEKLLTCIECLEQGKPFPSGLASTLPHLRAVEALDDLPVKRFTDAVPNAAGNALYVPGLAEKLRAAFAEGAMVEF